MIDFKKVGPATPGETWIESSALAESVLGYVPSLSPSLHLLHQNKHAKTGIPPHAAQDGCDTQQSKINVGKNLEKLKWLGM